MAITSELDVAVIASSGTARSVRTYPGGWLSRTIIYKSETFMIFGLLLNEF